jgi:hypothetical protein
MKTISLRHRKCDSCDYPSLSLGPSFLHMQIQTWTVAVNQYAVTLTSLQGRLPLAFVSPDIWNGAIREIFSPIQPSWLVTNSDSAGLSNASNVAIYAPD